MTKYQIPNTKKTLGGDYRGEPAVGGGDVQRLAYGVGFFADVGEGDFGAVFGGEGCAGDEADFFAVVEELFAFCGEMLEFVRQAEETEGFGDLAVGANAGDDFLA